MKKREWNEEEIKQLLNQLPSITDHRTSSEMYQHIERKIKGRNQRTWIAPTIATLAALFLFALMTPYLFQEISSSSYEEAADESGGDQDNSLNSLTMGEGEIANIEEKSEDEAAEAKLFENKNSTISPQDTFVIHSKDREKYLTFALTNEQSEITIPISFNEDEHVEDLKEIERISSEEVSEIMESFRFELEDTTFAHTKIPNEVIVNYQGQPNLSSSASEIYYMETIQETFRWLGYKKARLQTREEEGIEFGNTGMKTELDIETNRKKAYFIYRKQDNSRALLVPSNESFETIEDAVLAMKEGTANLTLESPFITTIDSIEIDENKTDLDITFPSNIEFEDSEPYILMLESLLLTAKEFGFQKVQFNGVDMQRIGVMNLAEPIEVPFAPNPISFHNK
ncbi:hypothetical protein [Bacillus weihaiensis]|uniref:hypothetical protein n=1 Tax=Bacillus weihaiensis TaxID=1547283 RepID=UPI002354F90E|nr:hypothetical protein [Bacillus weihaiensis]